MELFPNHRGLPKACIKELKDVFSHGLCGMFVQDNRANPLMDPFIAQITLHQDLPCFRTTMTLIPSSRNV